jgi:chemotaxis protein methyltransferase CheR
MSVTPKLTPEELDLLNDFLTGTLGLHFPEHKREILESRLRPRLQDLGLRRFIDYFYMLQMNPNGELGLLSRLITNNETYFFREIHQFEALFGDGLDLIKSSLAVPDSLRILCAGCSSGEEPYTLSIYAKENQYRLWNHTIAIDAFDIDTDRLQIAKSGLYGKNSFRFTTEEQLEKYFRSPDDGRYEVKPLFRSAVQFSRGNIVQLETYQKPIRYDVIFCRNVLIYFSEPSLEKAIENFAACLRSGGLLFLGHSESIIGMSRHFESVKVGSGIAYVRA